MFFPCLDCFLATGIFKELGNLEKISKQRNMLSSRLSTFRSALDLHKEESVHLFERQSLTGP